MSLKITLAEKGLEVMFPGYVAECLRHMWRFPGKKWSSLELHQHVMSEGVRISRASVINAMTALVETNFLAYEEEPCRGGYRGLYSHCLTPMLFAAAIEKQFDAILDKMFSEDDWSTEVR